MVNTFTIHAKGDKNPASGEGKNSAVLFLFFCCFFEGHPNQTCGSIHCGDPLGNKETAEITYLINMNFKKVYWTLNVIQM